MKCGDCNYYGDACPCGNGHGDEQHPDDDACVLGDRLADLEAERDRLVAEHMDCTAIMERNEARAERAKWERAAWELATILHQAARIEHADDTITTLTVPQSESEWIERALSAPQAQEEEKP